MIYVDMSEQKPAEPPRSPRRRSVLRSKPVRPAARRGEIRPMVLLWALGVPIPIVLLIFLVRGCS